MASTTDPSLNYYQQVLADESSNNPTTGLVGAEGMLNAPTVAQQGVTIASGEQQLGDLAPGLQQQSDYATMMAQNQLTGLGINQQETNLAQAGNTEQTAATMQQQQEQGVANNQNFGQQLQSLIGGQAASGALSSTGAKNQIAASGLQDQQANTNLTTQKQLTADEYARAQQQYELMGQANGLSAQEVQDKLSYGIDQLGEAYDPSALVASIGGGLTSENSSAASTIAQAGLITGTNLISSLG